MIKLKIQEWLKRYLPAEIVGTITAIGVASIIRFFYESAVFTAYAGSVGEAVGFYSTIFIQHILVIYKKKKIENKTFSITNFPKIITNIILEFGPAGMLDGLFLRPFFMYLFPVYLKNFALGIFVGKIVGDIAFYFLVILSYELKKQNKKI